MQGNIVNGMTCDEVRSILGEPNEIMTSKETKYLNEGEMVWRYDRFSAFAIPFFVYFVHGFVADINDNYKK